MLGLVAVGVVQGVGAEGQHERQQGQYCVVVQVVVPLAVVVVVVVVAAGQLGQVGLEQAAEFRGLEQLELGLGLGPLGLGPGPLGLMMQPACAC